jgi:hypothetical protein
MNYNTLAQTLPQDTDGVLFDVGSLYACLLAIPDPRKRRGRRYALALILVAMFLAKLAGQDTPEGIAAWVRLRTDLFAGLFQLKRARMPHAATYRRVAS